MVFMNYVNSIDIIQIQAHMSKFIKILNVNIFHYLLRNYIIISFPISIAS